MHLATAGGTGSTLPCALPFRGCCLCSSRPSNGLLLLASPVECVHGWQPRFQQPRFQQVHSQQARLQQTRVQQPRLQQLR